MSDTEAGARPTPWRWLRPVMGVALLTLVIARTGVGPFEAGLRLTTPRALATASAVTAVTTVCCAWRWRLVADGLGVRIGLGTAVAAIYRSQFLNATLPGGVLGDVDRAVGHARRTDAAGPAVRSVVWERTLGQVVQVLLTATVLVALPSPLRGLGVAVALAAVVGTAALLATTQVVRRTRSPLTLVLVGDARAVLRARRRRVGIAVASAGSALGHLVVFVVAARVGGVEAPPLALLPLAAVVLLAAAVPLNVAGWGPREGMAAWAFGVAGWSADAGVTAAVVYGVMALVATLPGAIVLVAGRTPRAPSPSSSPVLEEVACA